jgi:hypothetical protein
MADSTLAQIPPVDQRPAETSFADWRELGRTDYVREYEQTFTSAFVTGTPVNNEVRLRVSIPTDAAGPFPVVIILHYWGAVDLRLETAIAEALAVRGVASIIMPLPYHLSRAPSGTRSGEMAIRPDPSWLAATMTQAVFDVRRTLDWIQLRPEFRHDTIGLAGTSLGSLVGELAFAIDSRLRTAAFVLGGADLAHILWHSSRVVAERDALRRNGYTEARLRTELESVEPLTYLPGATGRPTLVISAQHDTIIPPAATAQLVSALESPETLVLDSGHFGGFLVERRLTRTVAGFLAARLVGQQFRVPDSLYVPSIRVGLSANAARGLQVAAGIDLWRVGANGDGFVTALITPKGVEAFVGFKVSTGLAIGAAIVPVRIAPGAFWSIVL